MRLIIILTKFKHLRHAAAMPIDDYSLIVLAYARYLRLMMPRAILPNDSLAPPPPPIIEVSPVMRTFLNT